ncbi:uncharacterized protein LOC123558710 [Mercenaria mercenaria]|uniref:uncharacterized protein LOC123558710 n=1 Tax=Mercenaria mercenaria TaxID=6596 RepID=UPI00234E58DA|nr:uncharacterized protein LOC123558710 [Mercenaria mercenaria]
MHFVLFKLTLFVHLTGITEAFQCYQCSYDKLSNTGKDWNNPKCMTAPGELDRRTTHYPCNDTGFCTFTETYSLVSKVVTSYYRSCHITSLGNQCTQEATRLMCFGSCKGDFCNRNDTGRQHVKFFGNSSSSIYTLTSPLFIYVLIYLCVCNVYKSYFS